MKFKVILIENLRPIKWGGIKVGFITEVASIGNCPINIFL
jgi:hypothetical protein